MNLNGFSIILSFVNLVVFIRALPASHGNHDPIALLDDDNIDESASTPVFRNGPPISNVYRKILDNPLDNEMENVDHDNLLDKKTETTVRNGPDRNNFFLENGQDNTKHLNKLRGLYTNDPNVYVKDPIGYLPKPATSYRNPLPKSYDLWKNEAMHLKQALYMLLEQLDELSTYVLNHYPRPTSGSFHYRPINYNSYPENREKNIDKIENIKPVSESRKLTLNEVLTNSSEPRSLEKHENDSENINIKSAVRNTYPIYIQDLRKMQHNHLDDLSLDDDDLLKISKPKPPPPSNSGFKENKDWYDLENIKNADEVLSKSADLRKTLMNVLAQLAKVVKLGEEHTEDFRQNDKPLIPYMPLSYRPLSPPPRIKGPHKNIYPKKPWVFDPIEPPGPFKLTLPESIEDHVDRYNEDDENAPDVDQSDEDYPIEDIDDLEDILNKYIESRNAGKYRTSKADKEKEKKRKYKEKNKKKKKTKKIKIHLGPFGIHIKKETKYKNRHLINEKDASTELQESLQDDLQNEPLIRNRRQLESSADDKGFTDRSLSSNRNLKIENEKEIGQQFNIVLEVKDFSKILDAYQQKFGQFSKSKSYRTKDYYPGVPL